MSFKTYKVSGKRGIDDLECEYAWIGNSQGDESATNDSTVGLTSGGWMSFVFHGINKYDQKAIDQEALRRKQRNQEYIELLKKEGKYGQEYGISIHLKENPVFDNNTSKVQPESSRMFFIDNDKEDEQRTKEVKDPQAE